MELGRECLEIWGYMRMDKLYRVETICSVSCCGVEP